VYFFYNPSFRYLQLGKVSALAEIWLARQLCGGPAQRALALPRAAPPLLAQRWWDANFYVHACASMAYKRVFAPSQLLCPAASRGAWVDLTPDVLRALDADPAQPLAPALAGAGAGARALAWPAPPPAAAGGLPALCAAVRAAAEAAAADAAAHEAHDARRALPRTLVLVPPARASALLVGQLTAAGKDMLAPGLLHFAARAGPRLVARTAVDPAWLCGLHAQAAREEGMRKALRDAAALRRLQERQRAPADAAAGDAAAANAAEAAAAEAAAPAAADDDEADDDEADDDEADEDDEAVDDEADEHEL
jgi:hypothetical protein